jgi:hypothetical protein
MGLGLAFDLVHGFLWSFASELDSKAPKPEQRFDNRQEV